MKVLITGVAGFFGSNLAEYFLNKNYQVVGIDNFNDYYSPKVKEYNISEFKDHSNFKLYRKDILDLDSLKEVFDKDSFHTVVHLAAWAGVTKSIDSPNVYVRNNIEGTVNVAEFCVKYGVKSFIFASTSSIYGPNPTPFSEDMKITELMAPYPVTKRACELMLRTYANNFKLPVTVIRIFNPQGKRMRPDLALPKLVRSCEYGTEFPVYWKKDQWESIGRDYCYIGHMFEAIDEIIKDPFNFEIFNLGNSNPVTLLELFETVEKVTGKKLNLKIKPNRKGEMFMTYANINKARKMLDYNPKTSIEDSIRIFYNWYLKQEKWYKKGQI